MPRRDATLCVSDCSVCVFMNIDDAKYGISTLECLLYICCCNKILWDTQTYKPASPTLKNTVI